MLHEILLVCPEVHPGCTIGKWSNPMADDLSTNKLLLIIIAILLPPLAVYLKTKSLGMTILDVVLCIFFYLPGLLMALWVVLKD